MTPMKVVAIAIVATIIKSNYLVSAYVRPLHNRISICSVSAIKTQSTRWSYQSTAAMKMANSVDEYSYQSPSMRIADGPCHSPSLPQRLLQKLPPMLKKMGASAFPFIVQLAVMVLFSAVHPAFAKAAKKTVAKTVSLPVKSPPLWKKILEGVNTSGAFKARKAGDTRTEFAAVLNSISSLLILGAIFFGAFLRHLQRENYQTKMMRKELKKVDEYKENMYFEAVQDILTKVNDPKTKGSTKASLQKQLKDLDPEGSIQKFLAGGERPDISHIINRKQKPKGKKGPAPMPDKSMKKKILPPAPTSSDFRDDDEDDMVDDVEEDVKEIPPVSKRIPERNIPKRNIPQRNIPQKSVPEKSEAEKSVPEKSVPEKSEAEKSEAEKSEAEESEASLAVKKTFTLMLGELYDGLEGIVSEGSRIQVIDYLKSRIELIPDPAKKMAVIRKVAEKLGDDDYWVDYAAKLG